MTRYAESRVSYYPQETTTIQENIRVEVNKHFLDFLMDWNFKTYLAVGGYGSGKSYVAGQKVVFKLLKEKRKCLVVREVLETVRDSCFALLEDICESLGLIDNGDVRFTQSPMQVRFKNGSQIIFRGMDKPRKLKSIHNISVIWIEECSELKYEGYKELLGRARHPSLSVHFILTTNPHLDMFNWVYTHFFKRKDEKTGKDVVVLEDKDLYKRRIVKNQEKSIYYHHSVVTDNQFADAEYIRQLEEIKDYDPDLYRIALTGQFGFSGKRVLPQFRVAKTHKLVMEKVRNISDDLRFNGMDFGFETSYNAVVRMAVDETTMTLYIYAEYYDNHKTDDETVKDLRELGWDDIEISADHAEPKAIRYYQRCGFNMRKCVKSSRLEQIRKMKRFKRIIVSPECKNVIRECEHLVYKTDRDGRMVYDEFTIDPHTFSAMWYGLDLYDVADIKEGPRNTAA